MSQQKEYLKRYFGYDEFRDGQETLISAILAGKDVLGIMPTGAGKSLCFQIPALMISGITIIVSPLISLMTDQVGALTQSGIPAAFFNSALTEKQMRIALQNAINGAYKLIYIAPERLMTSDFLSLVKAREVSMITVDEAHCISQWGHDFRPSYARIPEFVAKLEKRPILSAFTATATAAVRKDITELLGLQNPMVLTNGFDRQNLYFDVQKPKNKFFALEEYLKTKNDFSGIIYCSTRAAVEETCLRLNHCGYSATRYHAGLTDLERSKNQDEFFHDRVRLMVATNAFGMGIDKPNVSFVIHYDMPMNLENYYQEAGRAGRNGNKADCILLYGQRDVRTNLWLIDKGRSSESLDEPALQQYILRDRARLREMTSYCTTTDCLRGYILKYFGEKPANFCGNCGNCGTEFIDVSISSAVKKIASRLGFESRLPRV